MLIGKKHMEKLSFERLVIVFCSGIQSLIFVILLHSIMSNTLPVGLGYSLGFGTGIATFLSFVNLTLCSAFGSNEKVFQMCRFGTLLPMIIFGALFVIGAANQ